MPVPLLHVRQIRDILTVDFVGAEHTGIYSMRKALVGFFDRRHDTQAEVECRDTLRVEARAPYRCAIA